MISRDNMIQISVVLLIISLVCMFYYRFGYLFYAILSGKKINERRQVIKFRLSIALMIFSMYSLLVYGSIKDCYYGEYRSNPFISIERFENAGYYDWVTVDVKEDSNILMGLVYPRGILDLELRENTGTFEFKCSDVIIDRLSDTQKVKNYFSYLGYLLSDLFYYTSFESIPLDTDYGVQVIDKENKCIYQLYESDLRGIKIKNNARYKILYAEDSRTTSIVECEEPYSVYMECRLEEVK